MSGRSKNHTLKGGTSPYSLCMGVPPRGILIKVYTLHEAQTESNPGPIFSFVVHIMNKLEPFCTFRSTFSVFGTKCQLVKVNGG